MHLRSSDQCSFLQEHWRAAGGNDYYHVMCRHAKRTMRRRGRLVRQLVVYVHGLDKPQPDYREGEDHRQAFLQR